MSYEKLAKNKSPVKYVFKATKKCFHSEILYPPHKILTPHPTEIVIFRAAIFIVCSLGRGARRAFPAAAQQAPRADPAPPPQPGPSALKGVATLDQTLKGL